MKKVTLFLITAIVFAVICVLQIAADTALPDTSLAGAVYVYNIDSGLEVFSKNSDAEIAPASAAKIMSAIIACEHYRDNYDEIITVSKEAVEETQGNNIGLAAGEEVSVRELLIALIAGGANDAANTFAIEISGSVDAFCDLMNEKAKEIGALNTVYKNTSGIDADGMVTTARDTALITAYAYRLPSFREFSMITRYVMEKTNKSAKRVIHNRNYLLSTNILPQYYDKDAIGLNSGYTAQGGFCTISASEKGGLTHIYVVMGCEKDENGDNASFYIVSDLIDYASANFGYIKVLDPGAIVYEIPVSLAKNVDYVIVSPRNKVEYFLPLATDVESEISYNVRLDSEEIIAPIYEGQSVGEIDVIYKSEVISSVALVSQSSVKASSWLRMLDYLKNLLKSTEVRITIIVFVILFAAYLLISYARFRNAYKNRQNKKRD